MRAATSLRLLLLPAALLVGACEDSPSPHEPPAAEQELPTLEGVPVRQDLAAFSSATHWADGYLETHGENVPSHSPGPTYSFNRAGRGTITVAKPAGTTGRYVATFSGLSALLGGRSTLHVTGYGATDFTTEDVYCKPVAAYLVSDKVEVRCFEPTTGLPVNAQFSLLVTRSYADLAFAYAHQATSTNYSPSSQGSWNPAGTSTVVRSGAGQYRVTFNNLGAKLPLNVGGHVQVNAVGAGSAYCNASNVSTNGTPNLSVDVRCYATSTGAPVNQRFTVLFVLPAEHLAYAWADQPTAATYSPLASYSSNPAGGAITITRSGVGSYSVDWAGADLEIIDEGNAQVTAYGSNAQCKVAGKLPNGPRVRCFAPNGAPVDSRFMVLYGS